MRGLTERLGAEQAAILEHRTRVQLHASDLTVNIAIAAEVAEARVNA
jgi:hypothetical protein